MANDKPTTFKMNTPLGTAKWPKLTAPDYGTAEHPKPEGEYSVKMVWNESDPAFQKFRAKMEGYLAEAEEAGRAQFAALKKPQRDKLGGICGECITPEEDRQILETMLGAVAELETATRH